MPIRVKIRAGARFVIPTTTCRFPIAHPLPTPDDLAGVPVPGWSPSQGSLLGREPDLLKRRRYLAGSGASASIGLLRAVLSAEPDPGQPRRRHQPHVLGAGERDGGSEGHGRLVDDSVAAGLGSGALFKAPNVPVSIGG